MTIPLRRSTDHLPREDGSCHAEPTEPVLGIRTRGAVAGLPADLLRSDETILLMLKPHPIYILLTSLGTLALLVAIVGGSSLIERAYGVAWLPQRGMLALCTVIGVMRLGWQAMEWVSRTYLLTDRRVIRVMGVGRVQIFQAPLRQVRNVEVITTLRERMTGVGTLSFSTVGPGVPEAYWVMVADPAAVRETILRAIERYGK